MHATTTGCKMTTLEKRLKQIEELMRHNPICKDQWEQFDGPDSYIAKISTDEEWEECISNFESCIGSAHNRADALRGK